MIYSTDQSATYYFDGNLNAAILKTEETLPDFLRITAVANNHSDEVVIRFNDEATVNADMNFDAEKMFGLEIAPQLNTVTKDNDQLSINSLPRSSESVTVPLNFELKADGSATFDFIGTDSFNPNATIFLEDKLTNTTVNLRQNNTYTFTHLQSNDAGRFLLHFNGLTGVGGMRDAGCRMQDMDLRREGIPERPELCWSARHL